MSKQEAVLSEVEDHVQDMDEIGADIENFCKLIEEGLTACQEPPKEIAISEIPNHVSKRVTHG